jgi:hypothetical protein
VSRSSAASYTLLLTLLSGAFLFLPAKAQAGAWTTGEGKVWGKVAVFHMDSDRLFVDADRVGDICSERMLELGERAPYDCQLEGGGGLKTTQLFFEGAIGLHERIDLWLQIPVILNGEFTSMFVDENQRGLGDIRFGTKALLLRKPVVLATRLRVKAPTGDFPVDAVQFPLGEGQWDVTPAVLASRSLFNGAIWVGAQLGYRARFKNDQAMLDLGDEVLGVAEGGGWALPWLYTELRYQLQWGFESKRTSGPLDQTLAPRRVMFLTPKLMVAPFRPQRATTREVLANLAVEWGVRIPVWGRGWPADPVWFIGVNTKLQAFPDYEL